MKLRKEAYKIAKLLSVTLLIANSFSGIASVLAEEQAKNADRTIRRTYIEDKKEKKEKLSIGVDESLSSPDTLSLTVKVDKQGIEESGLVVIAQKGLELKKETLTKDWELDDSYNENDLISNSQMQEGNTVLGASDELAKNAETLPPYGEQYHSYRLLPKVNSENLADELTVSFTKVSDVVKGEFVAVIKEDVIAYFKSEPSVFKDYPKKEVTTSSEDVNEVSPAQDPPTSETEGQTPESQESQASTTTSEAEGTVAEAVDQRGAIQIKVTKSTESTSAQAEEKDSANNAIEGAEFEVRNTEQSDTVYTGRTDKDGLVTISNLPLGTYTVVQKTTADNYELSKEETVVLSEVNVTKELTLVNNLKSSLITYDISSMLSASSGGRSKRMARSLFDVSLFASPTVTGTTTTTTTTTVSGN
ncbi:TPA: carboxypeptidase regulatory-like domain-containing protein, partial [Streptococcus suis]